MTPQQIVGMAARLLAVWLALVALSYFFSALSLAQQSAEDFQSFGGKNAVLAPYIATAVVYLVGALLLWLFPMAIGHKLIPRTKFQDVLRLPGQQVVAVACVVLGLIVIALKALPDISTYLLWAAFWVANGDQLPNMDANRHVRGLAGFVQLAAGLFLIVKARTLAARFMPSPDDASAPPETPDDASPAAP